MYVPVIPTLPAAGRHDRRGEGYSLFLVYCELPTYNSPVTRSPDLQSNIQMSTTPQTPDLFVFYDGACSLCRASIAPVQRLDAHQRIEFLDLHDPAAQKRFPEIDRELAMRWMQAVDARGRISSGVEAWARIGLRLPGWRYLSWILLVPGIRWLAVKIYSWIARNRYRWNRDLCSDGTCSVHLPHSSRN